MKFAASLFRTELNADNNIPQRWIVKIPSDAVINPITISEDSDENLGDITNQVLAWVNTQPTPDFHEESHYYWSFNSDDYDEVEICATVTSSGNILMVGNCRTDAILDTIFFGCMSTRGRVHQDFPDLEKWFPEDHQWYIYETDGPVLHFNNDVEMNRDFKETILPWEDKAAFLHRTRAINNSVYVGEVMDALKELCFTDYYSPDDIVKHVKDGTFYNGNLKGYQRKLLALHFADNNGRKEAAVRFVKTVAEAFRADNCNMFA